jgi:NAD(P)-dependent dehydrogenase (short-subunit alcohol dehydrogenase family)
VNAVSPGFTLTPALEAGLRSGALEEDALTRGTAMGRLVDPIEVGRAIAWLIGPGSSAVTGANLPVDAGFLAGVTWDAYGGFRVPETR